MNPNFPWLWLDDPEGVASFLRSRNWIDPSEQFLGCTIAGDGNMNLTLRVRTDQRSLILKQSRPWVEKYSHIDAPWDRMSYERQFYQRVQSIPEVASRMPRLLDADAKACALLLQDLSPARDMTSLYSGEQMGTSCVDALAAYLCALHTCTLDSDAEQFRNPGMRALNHVHMFVIPLSEQGVPDLDQFEPSFAKAASDLRNDSSLRSRIESLGAIYLAPGSSLLHGDFFPGSWLRSGDDVFVIDAEFSHAGRVEHDIGVAVAHICLASQLPSTIDRFLTAYNQGNEVREADPKLIAAFAGVEIIRRLIGVAQLPIPKTDGFRTELLGRASLAIHEEAIEPIWE